LLDKTVQQLQAALKAEKLGYAYPVLYNKESNAAWEVRKAGLGLLRNSAGDRQPVNLIEDCAVAPQDLPAYIDDLLALLNKYQVQASFYAHAGAGELHVEPMLNLRKTEDVVLFRKILADTAALVKKYKGSLSGEHGDGRLRGEFIEAVMGKEVMELFRKVKHIFDPNGIFNAGKIVDTPPMDSQLRMQQDIAIPVIPTHFNFDADGGIQKLAEKCSGSGDCRRSAVAGGLMCPSYMATRNEFDSTRARANVLRQFLRDPADAAPFNHKEIKEVMDLCLSCKGCKTECPSGVDITKMKAEFLEHYHQQHGVPLRSKLIGHFVGQMKMASALPKVYNAVVGNKQLRKWANGLIGFHPDRSLPLLPPQTLRAWYKQRRPAAAGQRRVHFFCDEFTNYLDVASGQNAILLLERLGYTVILPQHRESGRTFLSKGMVSKAAAIANDNIAQLAAVADASAPLVGIEPSALLTIRDEYKDLAAPGLRAKAAALAACSFTIEEFLYHEMKKGHIQQEQFHEETHSIVLHTHCYQKVLSSSVYSKFILSFPKNYTVTEIPSGCCGMAGSFGYEKEHYAVSQQVAELVLYPHLRKLSGNEMVAAAGTSCRHQIKDGTGLLAKHPVDILMNALK
ncbi:MAG TPA: FAD-linked oxidase C-terminal domain-containing protein, partial [Chitinophagaceae bacterium]|nr:FAD-linked oxidase C-terminal domain-containing protein [Chitinophagaceae bacterium]